MPPNRKRADDDLTDEEIFGSDGDVDALFADTGESDEELFGGGGHKLAETRGEPAGPPEPPRKPEEKAWYDTLLDTVEAAGQGVGANAIDELAGYARAGLGQAGLMRDIGSAEELQDAYKADLDRVVKEHPVAHGVGQAALGIGVGAALPAAGAGGVATQAIAQGLLAGGSEYADSRSPGRSLGMGALGAAAGAGGTMLGNVAARRGAIPAAEAFDRELQAAAKSAAPKSTPTPAPGPALEGAQADIVEEMAARYPGQLDMTAPIRAPRLPEPSSRELRDIALRRGANELPKGRLGEIATLLGDLVPGGGTAVRAAKLGKRVLGSDPVRTQAMASGHLVPNESARQIGRAGAEAAWELGGPLAVGHQVNAGDGGNPVRVGPAPRNDWTPTYLSPAEEQKFQADMQTGEGYRQWREEFEKQWNTKVDFNDPEGDYDYRGAWKAGIRPSRYQFDDDRYHWASSLPNGQMLKAPDHPTAWMEHFMRRTGVDPGSLGLKNEAQGKAYEHEKLAYGDTNTLNYALSATLHGGNTGLSQADEQILTKAVVSGDQDAINAADFRLRQRYPAYARRIERELRALNEED